MTYFLLLLIVLDQTLEAVLAKQYSVKARKNNVMLFSAVSAFFALLFFVINSRGNLKFNMEIVPYALLFAICFGTAVVTQVYAIKTGPLSLTTLFSSYSLLIPTVFGIVFLGDPVSKSLFIGLGFLVVSLLLINLNKNESLKFSPLWVVYVLLAFVSNGMCSTVQKLQQIEFSGAYKNEFMIIALFAVSIFLFAVGFAQKGKKLEMLRPCVKYGCVKGLGNGFMNYLVMTVSAVLPSAVLFPSISAGSIVLTFVVSLLVYKEKFSRLRLLGYFLGIAAVVFLNI